MEMVGFGVEEKRLGGPGHRVSVAQISESTVYRKHRLGGVPVGKGAKTGVVGIET